MSTFRRYRALGKGAPGAFQGVNWQGMIADINLFG